MKLLAARRVFAPLGARDFRLLWIGQTISALGNPFQVIALAWLVLQLKGSALDLANIMLALAIPQAIMTLAGGVITDRLDPRTVMLYADATRVLTSGSIALLASLGLLPFWLLGLILILHGCANGIFNPAESSIAPRLVPKEQLDSANSLINLVNQAGTFLGAIPAGIILAYSGPALAFALNSFSFVVAVIAALCMRSLGREVRQEKTSLWQEALQGFIYLKGMPWLIALLIMDSCAAIAAVGPTGIGLPLLARNTLHVGAGGYSLLVWGFGCGSIIGIFAPALYSPKRQRGRFFCLVQLVEGPLLAGVAFTPLPVAMFCLAMMGLLNGFLLVIFFSLIQANVAKNMLGRIMGFFMLASFGFVPLSQYSAGLVATFSGEQTLFLAAGGVMMLGALIGLAVPSLRNLD